MNKINDIESTLKSQGYKLTGQRRIIIDAFEQCPAHYTAQEIFEKVKTQNASINFSTVYRNLELLCKLGVIHKLNISSGINHFELKHDSHHHHVICVKCGDMQSIDLCPYSNLENKELEELGFVPIEHKFEIYGYCKLCSKDN
ncbi:MAG: Ferric uptake regulator, Fur family [Clostridia bacterium]|jgi:Fur family zinc uptake transcriptional regulator/Fur family ferric uptake transcriptional regulator|nr:Ferric uptake regulator, Fur family [Clostridia bacterium]